MKILKDVFRGVIYGSVAAVIYCISYAVLWNLLR